MIGGLKPYRAMKDSGVQWLGKVPQHWRVIPNRATFTEVTESGHSDEQMLSVTISAGVVRQNELIQETSKKDQSRTDKSAYKLVRPGDIVYNKMRAWQGAVGVSIYKGLVSPAYIVQRPLDSADATYMHYLLRTPAFATEAERQSYGIASDMWSLRPESFRVICVCVPPLPEQASIVRFLDHFNNRIDRYIRAKEKLINLLEEQKQAIVHEAVTGRIDVRTGQPYPTYKPSGVEWLGDVPAHWRVQRLKTLCSMQSGQAITAMSIDPSGRHPVYGGNGVRGFTREYTHAGEYVLIGRQGALCGNIHVVCGKFWASEHAVVATIRVGYVLDWFSAVLRVMNLNQYSIAAAQPGLAVERVLNLGIPVPAPNDQAMIAENIERRIAIGKAAIARLQREIIRLREYRTRLIADVVTGKLDVREAAAARLEVDPLTSDGDASAEAAA